MDFSLLFKKAIEESDLDLLRQIPKGDRHNHFFLGGNPDYIQKVTGIKINPLTEKLHSMEEMHKWVGENVGSIFDDKNRVLAIEACFEQAKADGVSVLETGEDVWANGAMFDGSIDKLINAFQSIHRLKAPGIDFRFQIGLSRHCPVELIEEWLTPFFERDCFYSIDLYGDELSQPIKNFKTIYKKAKEKGLILKAHVGEWGDADSIKEAVETLELDEVQHGIAAADSPQVMQWLANQGIILNTCPSSNVMLGRVERIENHPIRKIFDHGIKVTVNTDDFLIFGQSVSQEFLNLYQAKLFNSDELNEIRLNGLK